MGKYDDIINLPHHVSDIYKPMLMSHRAAQFAPFAALSGHDDAIRETARVTEPFKELTYQEKDNVSRKLNHAIVHQFPVDVIYFVPDATKDGGSYIKASGTIKKWDAIDKNIVLNDGLIISIDYISEIVIK